MAARTSRSRRIEVEALVLLSQTLTAKAAKDSVAANEAHHDVLRFRTEQRALRPAREAVALARKLVGKHHLPCALYALGEVQLLGGQGEDALRAAEEADTCYAKDADVQGQAMCLLLCAQAHFICDRISDAERVANDALERFQTSQDDEGEKRAREVIASFRKGPTAAAALPDIGTIGRLTASTALEAAEKQRPALDIADVKKGVLATTQEIAGEEDVDLDTPLMDAGIDSLSAISFAEQLSKKFNVRLGSQVIFDFPNINAVAEFIVEESQALP